MLRAPSRAWRTIDGLSPTQRHQPDQPDAVDRSHQLTSVPISPWSSTARPSSEVSAPSVASGMGVPEHVVVGIGGGQLSSHAAGADCWCEQAVIATSQEDANRMGVQARYRSMGPWGGNGDIANAVTPATASELRRWSERQTAGDCEGCTGEARATRCWAIDPIVCPHRRERTPGSTLGGEQPSRPR